LHSLKKFPNGQTIKLSLKKQLLDDFQKADITKIDKLILTYAEKITRHAHTIDQPYIDSLKSSGLTERGIHDIAQVTAYFNYVNRLADSLGVELE